ncbi:hypothetical protein RHGRI_034351 [Rhododendron griersonianum]|uniref:Neprosin PEP catalytic domain-containing protein n=1 Tax=Rhododendron griersonianum TaxID=479676 RepID=A0AAV6I305_9ERIC|nr:hypothetical protein RHGRI_034351 [Rhododendron griersonianum]
MSRRNIPRPSIPTKNANPARGRGTDQQQQQQQQKKQKLSDEVPPPSASKTAPSETRRPPPQKDQGRQAEGPIDLEGGPSEAEVLRPFSPTYTTADGRVLMLKDSVKEEPNLAAALKAYDRANKVTAERERYRTDRDNFRAKFKISETQLQETDAEVERLKKELAEAKAAAATAEADMEKMRGEEKKKLDEADAKGYEAGIKRAALEYTQTAHQMVNDALEERLPEFFELGYAAGAEAMADVLVVETDNKFRQQLPPPSDAYQATRCYNLLCSGFVQTNNRIAIGAAIFPRSSYNGGQYDISLLVWKDPKHGNWWLQFRSGSVVGYWPSFLFTHLRNHANMVQFGGEVVNTRPSGTHTLTQMGSGHFSGEGFGKASYFRNLQVVDWDNSLIPVSNLWVLADHPNCYDIRGGINNVCGNYFYYGGPGRNVWCP